jgi:hypothetical protein
VTELEAAMHAPLGDRLRAHQITLLTDRMGALFVPWPELMAYLGDLVNRDIVAPAVMPGRGVGPRDLSALAARHPGLSGLLTGFVAFVSQREADAHVFTNDTTVTIVLADGRRARVEMKPLKGGLELSARRGGARVACPIIVRSTNDFAPALAWVHSLSTRRQAA